MIVTNLAYARAQIPQTPAMQKALDFLESVQGMDLAAGRMAIDGEGVDALVSSYQTVAQSSPLVFEVHRKYIDMHHVVAGQEGICWAPAARLAVTRAYDEADEGWLGTLAVGQAGFVGLAGGDLAVMYPEAGRRRAGEGRENRREGSGGKLICRPSYGCNDP